MTTKPPHERELERLARRLARLREEAAEGASRAVADTAEEVRAAAQATLARAPGGLPRLAEQVETEGEGPRRAVVIRHPAAPHVEFGARRTPPRPFLGPAAMAARGSFREQMKRLIGRLVRGGG